MTMRDVSRQYLGNPDLWEDILRANHLSGVGEVRPGMTLYIPVQAITGANKAIDQAGSCIQEATKTGARIFAGEEISKAIDLRDAAIEKRKRGEWDESARLGAASLTEAKKALQISNANKNVPAEAALAFKKGDVEKRKAAESVWKSIPLHGILIEEERVRTLRESYAEILFRDESRIRLNANSQALIKKMRANLIENSDEASVSLIEGDVLALLAGGKKEGSFKLEVPNVETKINSERFWVGRNEESAKFANFNGELQVSASGGRVTIKENQGSIVPAGQRPTPPRSLLPPPDLVLPEANVELFDLNTELIWGRIDGAYSYRVEIANESGFTRLFSSRDTRNSKLSLPNNLEDGLYYWRTTAISADGLPGNPSASRIFRFVTDDTPPFLIINQPLEGAVSNQPAIMMKGSVESGAILSAGNDTIIPLADGSFSHLWSLLPGKNTITAKAVDRAGNITELKRTIVYMADETLPLELILELPRSSDGDYITVSREFRLTGRTASQAKISVTNEGLAAIFVTTADTNGLFEMNISITGNSARFVVKAVSTRGLETVGGFNLLFDNIPPRIELDEFPATVTNSNITLSGSVIDGAQIERNDARLSLTGNRFTELVTLKEGENSLRWTARDDAGNLAVEERSIVCDTQAPIMNRSTITPSTVNGGEQISIQIIASDASRLRKAAQFTIQIGSFSFSDNLLLTDPEKGIYSATVKTPLDTRGTVKLTALSITDQPGNRRDYPPWAQR